MAEEKEQVQRLREKSGASQEACREALLRSEGDPLDAILYLERTGRSNTASQGGCFTTEPGAKATKAARKALVESVGAQSGREEKDDWRDWAREGASTLRSLLCRATANQFEVWRKDKLMTSIPVLILVLLFLVAFWISVSLLFFGMIIGCRYRFVGPDLGRDEVNGVMNNVSATVDDVVEQVKREFGGRKK